MTTMNVQHARPVTAENLRAEALDLKNRGYRLVTYSCTELDDSTCDILYHFDKDLELVNLRLVAPKDQPVPSLSGILFAALLIENEIQDHFGLTFADLALDFGGKLYLEDDVQSRPFCKLSISNVKPS